jgi:catechol 2,3-dioxygenase-like lactoylglutathione lyase family enzyme
MSLDCSAHHTSFPVRDLARSRKFYEEVLGLKEIERPDIFGMGGVWYEAGPGQVHLIEVDADAKVGTPPPVCDPRARHAAFAVDDYQSTVDFLKSAELEVFETNEEYGQCWVQDPDGHVIELIVAS